MNRRTFLLFVSLLTVIILFFSSAFLLPVIYTYSKNATTLILLLLISSLASSLTIAIIMIYLSPTVNEGIALLKRYGRLENMTHPLLVRLSSEAPGTYHHCVNVANLAQRAAKRIGADTNLTRIASYYHDVGKLLHPEIYIENQSESREQFKGLAQIKKIAKIIVSHAKNGAKIAEEYKMPEEIVNIIAEHHGSTQAKFLYLEAKKNADVDTNDFKYLGPKPSTPESAIIMLADCIEAATKGAKDLNREKISEIVDKTIEEKIAEKQFYNLNFGNRELAQIRDSFVSSLSSMYHQRIFIEENDKS